MVWVVFLTACEQKTEIVSEKDHNIYLSKEIVTWIVEDDILTRNSYVDSSEIGWDENKEDRWDQYGKKWYTTDWKNVYLYMKTITGADVKTFFVSSSGQWVRDKNCFYFDTTCLENINPKKAQFLYYEYVKDMYINYKEGNNLNNTNKLLFILVFQLWYKRYMK